MLYESKQWQFQVKDMDQIALKYISHTYLGGANIETLECKQKYMSDVKHVNSQFFN